MNKNITLAYILIVIISLLTIACGQPDPIPSPTPTSDSADTTINRIEQRATTQAIVNDEQDQANDSPILLEREVEAPATETDTESPVSDEEPIEEAAPPQTPTINQEPLAYREHCSTDACQSISATYGIEIYGYFSDKRVERLQTVLDTYAEFLGHGNPTLGQAEFNERVSGGEGVTHIEFVEEMRSGRVGKAYARFAPDATPELNAKEPDVFAIWCSADNMVGPCAGFGVQTGTILVDVSTKDHLDELERTIAHELTHALDTKSGYVAREQFEDSGAAALAPEVGGSLQEQFAEIVALWLFPRNGDPQADWDQIVIQFIAVFFHPDYAGEQVAFN